MAPRAVQQLLHFLQNKRFLKRKEVGKSMKQWQQSFKNVPAGGPESCPDQDMEDNIIVEGLLLEDCGEDGFVQRWCVITREDFQICQCKGTPPSLTIPFNLVAEVRSDNTDTALELSRRYSTAKMAPLTSDQEQPDGMTALRSDLLSPSIIRRAHLAHFVLPREKTSLLTAAFDAWKGGANEAMTVHDSGHDRSFRRHTEEPGTTVGARRTEEPGPTVGAPDDAEPQDESDDDATDDSSVADGLDNGAFILVTKAHHFKPAKEFKFVASNRHVCDWWLEGVHGAIAHTATLPQPSSFQLLRKSVAMTYQSDAFQVAPNPRP